MKQFLPFIQIIVSTLLIAAILLQQRGTALGSAFGAGGEFYGTRRGLQKKLLYSTIALSALFVVLSLLNLILV